MGVAEIGQAGRAVLGQQHVGGLQVAVQDAQVVGAGQGVGHVEGDLDRALDGQAGRPAGHRDARPTVSIQQIAQRAARDVLHHQVVPPLRLKGVHHLDDVGMVQLAQRFPLAQEAGQGVGVAGHHFRPQGLDGHELPGLQVPAPVHVAHPAPAE